MSISLVGSPHHNVVAAGTPEQKERFMSRFRGGKPKWGAMAITEPGFGSDSSQSIVAAMAIGVGCAALDFVRDFLRQENIPIRYGISPRRLTALGRWDTHVSCCWRNVCAMRRSMTSSRGRSRSIC